MWNCASVQFSFGYALCNYSYLIYTDKKTDDLEAGKITRGASEVTALGSKWRSDSSESGSWNNLLDRLRCREFPTFTEFKSSFHLPAFNSELNLSIPVQSERNPLLRRPTCSWWPTTWAPTPCRPTSTLSASSPQRSRRNCGATEASDRLGH